MQRRGFVYPLIAVTSLFAFSPTTRKEGVKVMVTAVGADSVSVKVTGSLMNVGTQIKRRAVRYTDAAPYHTSTPIELLPLDLRDTLTISAAVGARIKVTADNMLTHQHLEGTGRTIQISRLDGQTEIKLTSTP